MSENSSKKNVVLELTEVIARLDSIKKTILADHKTGTQINIKNLINSVDTTFNLNPKVKVFKLNNGLVAFLVALILAALSGGLYVFQTGNVSVAIAVVSGFIALISLYLKLEDEKGINRVQEDIVTKVITSYNTTINTAVESKQALEKTIAKELIILRSKNKNQPLIDVFDSNPAMFEIKELLERVYS
jgi:hypothetical protein